MDDLVKLIVKEDWLRKEQKVFSREGSRTEITIGYGSPMIIPIGAPRKITSSANPEELKQEIKRKAPKGANAYVIEEPTENSTNLAIQYYQLSYAELERRESNPFPLCLRD